jgi:hypothetical protein
MAQNPKSLIFAFVIRSAVAGGVWLSLLLVIFDFTNRMFTPSTMSDRAFFAAVGAILGALIGLVVWATPRILKTNLGRIEGAAIGSLTVAIILVVLYSGGMGGNSWARFIGNMSIFGVAIGAFPGLVARPRTKMESKLFR